MGDMFRWNFQGEQNEIISEFISVLIKTAIMSDLYYTMTTDPQLERIFEFMEKLHELRSHYPDIIIEPIDWLNERERCDIDVRVGIKNVDGKVERWPASYIPYSYNK
jgi:hypothetical protein